MKIVVLDGYAANPGDLSWDRLSRLGDLTVYDRTPPDMIISRIGNAEVIYTNKTPITADTLRACPNLRFIGVLATGYNVVDVAAAKSMGVIVTNIPNYSTASVAQLTIALLLELCFHVGAHDTAVHDGVWSSCPDFTFRLFPLTELAGKTMGIIGYGAIGQAVARIAVSLGMKVLAFNKGRRPAPETEDIKYAEFDELISRSDVISLHCPFTNDNAGMINSNTIAKMKQGVFIINTARGPLIVEKDLALALESGHVGGAAVDVVLVEPIKPYNPLLTAKNCIITPHIAWAPIESRKRLLDIAAENLERFLAGTPINVVNG
ncbi:MAG TPA: D-2-hydroxyacid dehydrogenase [Clostridia bacterium]|nr:D-2-hydroxyacid dehydrogenase [Clostridia bacterium]